MNKLLRSVLAALALLPLAATAAPALVEGKDYQRVPTPAVPADKSRVTVEEFFWYGCPHCYSIDGNVDAWVAKKPASVDFVRIPNTLGRPEGETHARAFYIADVLNVGGKVHKPLFAAIHGQRLPMSSADQLRALFLTSANVQPGDFDKASSSFMVDSKLRRADQLSRNYKITGVPAFVVGGTYMTSPVMLGTGGNEKVFTVIDALVEKVRQERR